MRHLLLFCITVGSLLAQVTAIPGGTGSGSGTVTSVQAGSGIAVQDGTTTPTVSVDDAIIPVYSTGAGIPSANCVVGREIYIDTTNARLYTCVATNTWGYAAKVTIATTAPVTCTVGDLFFDSDATAGSNLFGCTSTNTFTALGGGGSSAAAESIWLPAGQRTATSSSVYQWIIHTGVAASTFTYNAEALANTSFLFDGAATEVLQTWFLWPESWNNGTFDVRIFHRGATATAGNIRWQFDIACVANGTDLDDAFTFGASPGLLTVANGGDGVLGVDTLSAMAVPSSCPGAGLALFKLSRLGGDAADTSAVDHHFLGLELKYTRSIP